MDSAADLAVREACAKGSSQAAPQSPESAMEALGFKPKPPPHDAARSDTNHPTRAETFRGLESGGFQGCGFKGFGFGAVMGLFAALWKGARGDTAALVRNARGIQLFVPALLPEGRRSFVVSSVRAQVGSLLCRSGRSGGVTLECPALPLGPSKLLVPRRSKPCSLSQRSFAYGK